MDLNTASREQLQQPFRVDGTRAEYIDRSRPANTRLRSGGEMTVVARAAAGDEQAFAELYTRNRRRIYWLCVRMTHDITQAEDLTQDVFLQAYRRLGTYRGDSAFSTWLHRVAVNVVLMHLRKNSKSHELSIDELNEHQESGIGDSKELSVHDFVLTGCVDRVTIEKATNDLAPGYRMCFLLHDVEGYEHHEVAEMLGVSEGSSKSQLHKARLRLRHALQRRVALEGTCEEPVPKS